MVAVAVAVAGAGAGDPVCPPELLREIADGVQRGRLVVLDGVAHQAPDQVARAIRELASEVS